MYSQRTNPKTMIISLKKLYFKDYMYRQMKPYIYASLPMANRSLK